MDGFLVVRAKTWAAKFVDVVSSLEASFVPLLPTLLMIAGENLSYGGLVSLALWRRYLRVGVAKQL